MLPVKDWSRGLGLPEQRLEVMNYTDTTIAEDDPFVGVATCTWNWMGWWKCSGGGRGSVCVTRLGDKVWSFTKLDNISLSKIYTRPRKNAKSAFFHNGDDWLCMQPVVLWYKCFRLKEVSVKQNIQGFVGTGAFIWEDNIAGRVFPFGTRKRYFWLEVIYDELRRKPDC